MRVVVGTRNLNEEELLPVFLAAVGDWADAIVIADGGSTDRSKEIALAHPKVIWHDFQDRVPGKHGGWRNPEGKHMRFLLDKCEELEPDWLWITETDAIPNVALQEQSRSLLTRLDELGCPLLMTWLCYVAPDGKSHYPKCMQGPGYTAWKPGMTTIETGESGDFEGQGRLLLPQGNHYDAGQALSRIHLAWETDEKITAKHAWYAQVHDWDLKHPDVSYGPREPLPDWAIWTDLREPGGLAGHGVERTWV